MTLNFESALTWPSGVDGNADFEGAFAAIESRAPFVFITGKAGTGKSTFVQSFKSMTSRRMAVVAPTGVAALNAGGQTIHSFFKIRPGPINLDDIRRSSRRKLYQKLDLLVIDEVSMVRADLLDAIDKFLRLNGPEKSLPFGGIQVVAVGDLHQLPPVVAAAEEARLFSEWYETEYFFSAHALSVCPMKVVEFSLIYRQSDELFLRLLNRIREGEDLEETVETLNRVCVRPLEKTDAVTLTCTNLVADRINARRLAALGGETVRYEGHVTGEFDINRHLPAPLELRLKVGAQVMFTKNDALHRWVNGDHGKVVELRDDRVIVALAGRDEVVVDVEPATWESVRYFYDEGNGQVRTDVIGEYQQIPLMPAWAITIHKSQGKTLAGAIIDTGSGAFAHGQIYVALSRCRSLDSVQLTRPLRVSDVRLDERVRDFHRRRTVIC
jgi:ATP-dependent exoDNAse (exonuclease V) alpha subunit